MTNKAVKVLFLLYYKNNVKIYIQFKVQSIPHTGEFRRILLQLPSTKLTSQQLEALSGSLGALA